MSRFKVGDKVISLENEVDIKKGSIYIITRNGDEPIFRDDNGDVRYRPRNHYELFEEKQFTQQDLEVGMWVELEPGSIKRLMYVNTNRLCNEIKVAFDLLNIYKPNENGDLIKIWEREEEKLYTLELPNNKYKNKFYGYNLVHKNVYRFGKLADSNNPAIKCYFTEKEIDHLPNQEFIKTLVKVEVK